LSSSRPGGRSEGHQLLHRCVVSRRHLHVLNEPATGRRVGTTWARVMRQPTVPHTKGPRPHGDMLQVRHRWVLRGEPQGGGGGNVLLLHNKREAVGTKEERGGGGISARKRGEDAPYSRTLTRHAHPTRSPSTRTASSASTYPAHLQLGMCRSPRGQVVMEAGHDAQAPIQGPAVPQCNHALGLQHRVVHQHCPTGESMVLHARKHRGVTAGPRKHTVKARECEQLRVRGWDGVGGGKQRMNVVR
jgi:hypothetical protein